VAGSNQDERFSTSVPSSLAVTGTYAIDSVGRGTMNLTNGATYIFYMIAASGAGGSPIATLQESASASDSSSVRHGMLVQQSGLPSTANPLSGSYALILGGHTSGKEEDIVGQLTANASGSFTSGTLDINSFGVTTGATGEAVTGTFAAISSNGRGVMTLNPTSDNRILVLYFVSPTQALIMSTDTTRLAVGSVYKQF